MLLQSPPPELVKIDTINGCAFVGCWSHFFSDFLLLCNSCSLLTIHGFVGFKYFFFFHLATGRYLKCGMEGRILGLAVEMLGGSLFLIFGKHDQAI